MAINLKEKIIKPNKRAFKNCKISQAPIVHLEGKQFKGPTLISKNKKTGEKQIMLDITHSFVNQIF